MFERRYSKLLLKSAANVHFVVTARMLHCLPGSLCKFRYYQGTLQSILKVRAGADEQLLRIHVKGGRGFNRYRAGVVR